MKATRNLSLPYLLGAIFVLFSAAAGTGWLYGPDVFLMLGAQSWPSDFLDVAFGFLSAFGSLEVTLEYLLKQFLPVLSVPTGFARTQDFAPLIVADHSYPYPSGHALRFTIVLGTIYLLQR